MPTTRIFVVAPTRERRRSRITRMRSARVRLLAGRRLRVGRSVGYDHKAMGITARGAWRRRSGLPRARCRHPDDRLHRRRHRRHVGRRLRQRHAAVEAHQAGGAFDHRTSSSIRTPTAASHASASVCSICRAPPGRTTTRADLRGAASTAQRQVDRDHARGRRGARHRRRCAHPTELVNAILKAPWTCSTRRHRHLRQGDAETHAEVGDRANDALRVNALSSAARSCRGRQPRLHAARKGRVCAGGRPDQHRRDRQLAGVDTPTTKSNQDPVRLAIARPADGGRA